jgi:hypothetical protein
MTCDSTSIDPLAGFIWGGVGRPSPPQLFVQVEASKFHILLNCYSLDHSFWHVELENKKSFLALCKHRILPVWNQIHIIIFYFEPDRPFEFLSFLNCQKGTIQYVLIVKEGIIASATSASDWNKHQQRFWCNQRVTVSHFEADRPFRSFSSSTVKRVPSSTYWQSRKG